MRKDRRVSRLSHTFLGVAALALLAISVVAAQRGGGPRSTRQTAQAGTALNAVPPDLGPNEKFQGVPWAGQPGVTVSVAELMALAANEPDPTGPPRERRHQQNESEGKIEPKHNPFAPAVSQWPPIDGLAAAFPSSRVAFNMTTNWLGPTVSESGFIPPDSNGAVGPTQVLVTANGRFKVYDKLGNLGGFNVTDQTFWSAVITPGVNNFVSDPHVRYDRLSSRWFISEIDVPEPCECSNRILIAVSSGSTITDSSSFTLFQFQHDLVAPASNPDVGKFADYDTLGVDANALYIGANIFNGAPPAPSPFQFSNTTGYVVNKASLLSGSLVVTAFRQLLNPSDFSGPYTPQGVSNDTAGATEGYFIGVDGNQFGRLAIRRISTPGGTPSISGSIFLTTPSTSDPIPQVAQGSVRPLDAVDWRLMEATITQNRLTGPSSLWTAHNIGVDTSGVATDPPTASTRNGMRWYQIDNLSSTPTLTQSGTVFDSAASNPVGWWMGSIAANGQGHAAIGQSYASSSLPASVGILSRLASDPPGQTSNFQFVFGVPGYNIQTTATGTSPQRWGDFSQVVVDPTDDMTLWTFQEYCDNANNVFFNGRGSWGVRAVKLQAPPPATPVSASPPSVRRSSSVTIVITGASTAGSGFFDPGIGFPNHLTAAISGGVVVNSVMFLDPTHVALNLSTAAASPGAKDVMITNPDGQSLTGLSLFSVTSGGVVTGDFDGDTKSDLTVFRPSTGAWHVLKSSTNYTTSQSFTWGLSTDVPVPGDYDGDGKIDPAIYRPSTGLWAVLKSSTNYTTSFVVNWGLSTDTPVPGDFDGDGKTDPAVYRPSTGGWFFLNSGTNYTTSGTVSWGLSTDLPVQGDFDGDGRTDPAIYRPSTGLWAVLKSSTNYTTSLTATWGLSTDVAVPGDYDGDGKVDPAIYRPSTGLWAVLKSSTNYTTSFVVNWGLSTDIPVAADYDGDGKFDPAIYRPSTGLWAALKSSTNYTSSLTMSWGLSTDAPINKRP